MHLAILVGVLNVEGLSEVLTKEVGRSRLESLTILHHSLNGEGVKSAREALIRTLMPHNHRQSHVFTREFGIDTNHSLSLLNRLLGSRMGRVSLLPEELGGTEEQPGAHLPTDNIRPLVAHDRQVPPRLDPVLVGAPDDSLGSGSHDQLFLKFRLGIDYNAFPARVVHQPVMGHHGALLGESGDMLSLLAEK